MYYQLCLSLKVVVEKADILTFILELACTVYALHPAYIAVTALQPRSSAPET